MGKFLAANPVKYMYDGEFRVNKEPMRTTTVIKTCIQCIEMYKTRERWIIDSRFELKNLKIANSPAYVED